MKNALDIGYDPDNPESRKETALRAMQSQCPAARIVGERARANGTKLGRRRVEPAVEARIFELKASGDGILKIGRKLGVGTSVVQRVFKQQPQPS